MDPVVKYWINGYHTFSNSPISKTDHLGNVDDWVTSKEKGTVYDSDVKSQKDAEKYYGKDAKRLEYDVQYESTEGGTLTLHVGDYYSLNGIKQKEPVRNQRFENDNYLKRRSWIEQKLYDLDDISDKYGPIIGYKYIEYTSIPNGIMNLASGLTGKDLRIPDWEYAKQYGDFKGTDLSTGRRFSIGVNGISKIFGGALASGQGLSTDILLEGFSDYNNHDDKTRIKLQTIFNIISSIRSIKKEPIKTVIETANFGVDITTEQIDKSIQKNE